MSATRTPKASALRLRLACEIAKGDLRDSHCGGFKTGCTSSVLGFYGIDKNSFKYCQTLPDMIRILNRNGFSAKNIGKKKESKKVIGRAVKNLNKFIFIPGFYLITVRCHVLLAYVSNDGQVSFPVDTDPRAEGKDLRRIECIHRIRAARKG